MRYKVIILFIAAIFLLTVLGEFTSAKKAVTMGRHPFIKVPKNTPTDKIVKLLIEKYPKDVQKGFELAGKPELYEPFMGQLQAGAYEEKQVMPGEKFMWMFFRVNRKIKVVNDLEWAGNKPLDIILVKAKSDNMIYDIAIVKKCVNTALLNVTEAPPEIPEPTCDMKLQPEKANIGESFTVDMSGSENAKTMEATIYDSEGNPVDSHSFTPDSPTWVTKLDKSGDYTIKGKASNERGEVTGPKCEAKLHINFPPDCKLNASCTMCKNMVGKPITLDASASSDTDGQIVKAHFEIIDEQGNIVDTYDDTEKPFVWEKVFDKEGNYTILCTVYDDMGASAGGEEPCKIQMTVTERKLFGVAELGPMLSHGTYTGFGFARGGILYKIKPDVVDFVFTLGVAGTTVGEPWKTFFMCNALINVHSNKLFAGAGIGYSGKERETTKGGIDFVLQGGVDIFKKKASYTGSIFGEFRVPIITSDRSFEDHHKILAGFKIIF